MSRSVAKDLADILEDNDVGYQDRKSAPEHSGKWGLDIGTTGAVGTTLIQDRFEFRTPAEGGDLGVENSIALSESGSFDTNPKWLLDELFVQCRIRSDAYGYEGAIEKSQEVKDILLGIDGPALFLPGSKYLGITLVTDFTLVGVDEKKYRDLYATFLVRREPIYERWAEGSFTVTPPSTVTAPEGFAPLSSSVPSGGLMAWMYGTDSSERYRLPIEAVNNSDLTIDISGIVDRRRDPVLFGSLPDPSGYSLRRELTASEIAARGTLRSPFA